MADETLCLYRYEKEFDAVQDVFDLQVCEDPSLTSTKHDQLAARPSG